MHNAIASCITATATPTPTATPAPTSTVSVIKMVEKVLLLLCKDLLHNLPLSFILVDSGVTLVVTLIAFIKEGMNIVDDVGQKTGIPGKETIAVILSN